MNELAFTMEMLEQDLVYEFGETKFGKELIGNWVRKRGKEAGKDIGSDAHSVAHKYRDWLDSHEDDKGNNALKAYNEVKKENMERTRKRKLGNYSDSLISRAKSTR